LLGGRGKGGESENWHLAKNPNVAGKQRSAEFLDMRVDEREGERVCVCITVSCCITLITSRSSTVVQLFSICLLLTFRLWKGHVYILG
jgi:hypothetical protein